MAELIANSPTPGQKAPLCSLASPISDAPAQGTVETITTTTSAPAALQGGQFRIVIDTEILLVTAGQTGTTWTVTRGVEGSTTSTHTNSTAIYHDLTAAGLTGVVSAAATTAANAAISASLDTNPADITMDGTALAGSVGKPADAGHRHPTDTSRAPLASPTLTGTPTVPTAAADTNTTQVASTAFVLGQAGSATPVVDGTAAPGTSTRLSRQDHVHPTDTSRMAASTTLDAVPAPAANVGLNSKKITSLANGSAATDAAAFGQIPTSASAIGGVLAANNGSDFANVGATRGNLGIPSLPPAAVVDTANDSSLSGLQTIDGYTLVAGDIVLLVAQATASQNGPWVAASGAWTRPAEFASGALVQARTIAVINGTVNGPSGTSPKPFWLLQTNSAITVDTTAQTWVQASQSGGSIGSPAVALTGTPTSGQVPTATSGSAATWQAPTGGGSSIGYMVTPSGDATGATDKANINTALGAHSEVWLQGSYTINGPIVTPSNATLIIADASIFLANGSNSNLIKNADHTGGSGGNTNIRILGIGKALLDGNLANQTSGESWTSHGVMLSHVTKFEVGNLQIQNVTRYGISPQHSSDGVVHDIWGSQIGSTEQAIVQTLGDISNVVIERIRGVSEDDSIGISTGEILAYQGLYADGSATGNISDVVIRDIEVSHTTAVTVNVVRIFGGGGYTIKRITVENTFERFPSQGGQCITFGSDSFATSPPAPGDISDITIRNTNCRLLFQSPCSAITIDGVQIPAAATNNGIPITFEGSAAGRAVNDLLIDNVVFNGPAQTQPNPFVSFNDKGGTLTVNRLKIGQNVKIAGPLNGWFGVTGTGVKITGLKYPDIYAPGLAGIPASGANYAPNVARSNVFAAGDQAVVSGGWVVPTPDGTKAYRLAVDNTGAFAATRVPYFNRLVMSLGPVGYWRLNDSSGAVMADQLGNAGTYVATPTLGSTGLLNTNGDDTATSVTFTAASSQYGLVSDSADFDFLKALSIIAIIKPTSASGYQGIFAKGANASVGDYGLALNSGHLSFFYNNSSSNFFNDTATLTAATTYFVAVTYDGANVRFYVAGALSTSPALSSVLNATSGANVYIARRSDGNYFGGSIQEVAIFNYAISGTAISQLHSIAGV